MERKNKQKIFFIMVDIFIEKDDSPLILANPVFTMAKEAINRS